jgi:2-isopropylmalate synthase
VRVLIDTKNGASRWSTVGASANIIEASWRALADSMEFALLCGTHVEPDRLPSQAVD